MTNGIGLPGAGLLRHTLLALAASLRGENVFWVQKEAHWLPCSTS